MKKLLAWCRRRGIHVELTTEISFVLPELKRIGLCWHQDKNTLLFEFLHECGHYLIWQERKRNKRYRAGTGDPRTRETKLAIVDEEIEAWYRGRRLAKRLGIKINAQAWAKCRAKNLRTYKVGV